MAQESNRSVTEVCDTWQCSVCLSDVSSPPVYQCDDRTNEIRVVCKTCREKVKIFVMLHSHRNQLNDELVTLIRLTKILLSYS